MCVELMWQVHALQVGEDAVILSALCLIDGHLYFQTRLCYLSLSTDLKLFLLPDIFEKAVKGPGGEENFPR